MSKHWFFSDPHFGHGNIMKYCRRTKYMTPEEIRQLDAGDNFHVSRESVFRMNDALLANINSLVQPDDVLWCLGDFCFAGNKDYYSESYIYRNRIKCKNVHMIWGNHDTPTRIAGLFNSNHEQVMIAIDPGSGAYHIGEETIRKERPRSHWVKLMLNHYFMAIWNGSHKGVWHLYGHSHANAEAWADAMMPGRRCFDCGVDNANKVLGDYRPFGLDEVVKIMQARPGFWMDHHGKRGNRDEE